MEPPDSYTPHVDDAVVAVVFDKTEPAIPSLVNMPGCEIGLVFFRLRSMRPFVLPIQGRQGSCSSQADPLPLGLLGLGRTYGSDGMD